MAQSSKIALIHATATSIEPILNAFKDDWPEAVLVNLLDDSLSVDRNASDHLTDTMTRRILDLAIYAANLECHGILFTCSAFGRAIEKANLRLSIPILKPNEAMFEAALKDGRKVAMLYTFEQSRAGMEEEFHASAKEIGSNATIESFYVPDAMRILAGGDAETHNKLIQEKAKTLKGFDTVMLAQFSTSRAKKAVEAVVNVPVFTSPQTGLRKMRHLLSV